MISTLLKTKSMVVLCILIFLLFFLPLVGFTLVAAESDNIIAEKYAPVLYFEKEEKCYPVDALYHISNSNLMLGSEINNTNPTSKMIGKLTNENYYLDNRKGTANDDNIINDYQNELNRNAYENVVYYRVYQYDATTTVVQYWMFYAFNKGELNQHEGDWEMVQVVLLNNKPSWVAYSQHHSGQQATWDQVEKDGYHIKVYVARGSHANYLRSYSGKLGVANDVVGDNGETWKPGNYILADLDSQDWLNFPGKWGEVGASESEAVSSYILGEAGPEGPKYREEGKMYNDPLAWGRSLPKADDLMFIAEWFFYNFILIYLLIFVVVLSLMVLFIYRRHKRYGLGPRVVSMLYIDGINLKSIGNILCFVGIILAIFGLFNTWYEVSYNFSGSGAASSLNTEGWQDILKIDGLNGIQLVVPGENGAMPVGNFVFPFSLLLGIGLIFLVISTIGVFRSTKLGFKYVWRGVRLFSPIVLILVVMIALGSIVPTDSTDNLEGAQPNDIFSSISNSPFGGQESYNFKDAENPVEESATMDMKWGLGLGGIMLLVAGIILIVSGIIEITAKTRFFEPKIPEDINLKKKKFRGSKKIQDSSNIQQQTPSPVQQPPQQQTGPPPPEEIGLPQKKNDEDFKFCPKCGAKISDGVAFCMECGNKIK